jgi:hypothetical protein
MFNLNRLVASFVASFALTGLVAVGARALILGAPTLTPATTAPPPVNCATQTADVNVSLAYDNAARYEVDVDGYDTSTGCVLDSIDFYQSVSESSTWELESTSLTTTKTFYLLDAAPCGTAYAGLAGPAFYRTATDPTVLTRLWIAIAAADYTPSGAGYALTTYDGTTDFGGTSGVTMTHTGSQTRVATTSTSASSDLAKFSHASVRLYWQPQWINFEDTQGPVIVDQYSNCTDWANEGAVTTSFATVGGNLHIVYHGH